MIIILCTTETKDNLTLSLKHIKNWQNSAEFTDSIVKIGTLSLTESTN